MMPWKLYADAAAYIFTWLLGYSSLMGAIGGVLIADYWVLRRRAAVAARSVQDSTGTTPTRTASTGAPCGRWCWPSLPVVPGFLRAAATPGGTVADPTVLDTLYTYAWFVTFLLSAGLYLALSRKPAMVQAARTALTRLSVQTRALFESM